MMTASRQPSIAIVDYGMGNLFSVQQACAAVGLHAIITSTKEDVLSAGGVILPGVGAFGDAMATLRKHDLVSVVREVIVRGTPFMGICLGMQLLMTESEEFGPHHGLDVFRGSVIHFDRLAAGAPRTFKVPHVGWSRVRMASGHEDHSRTSSMLSGVPDGTQAYFVHSYCVVPESSGMIASLTQYGGVEFCSSIQHRMVFACQFHPERSGPPGLQLYRNFASQVSAYVQEHTGYVRSV